MISFEEDELQDMKRLIGNVEDSILILSRQDAGVMRALIGDCLIALRNLANFIREKQEDQ